MRLTRRTFLGVTLGLIAAASRPWRVLAHHKPGHKPRPSPSPSPSPSPPPGPSPLGKLLPMPVIGLGSNTGPRRQAAISRQVA